MFFLKLWNMWWFFSGEAKDEFPGWKYKESRSFHTGTLIFSAFWSAIVNVPLEVTVSQGFAWSSTSIALHLKERDGTTLLQKPWPKLAKVFQSLLVDNFILFVAEERVWTSLQKLACEQAPLFGQTKRASRERAAHSRVFARLVFHSPK